MTTQLQMESIAPSYDLSLSQWFTPPELAKKIVDWAGVRSGDTVLEPSAGAGSFVLTALKIGARVTAFEIDARFFPGHISGDLKWNVLDFFSVASPDTQGIWGTFDFAITNPPYENGQDLKFIEACTRIAETTIALTKTSFFHGVERGEKFWKHWRPTRLVFLSSRPRFSGSEGSAKTDFCIFELKRSNPKPASTKIEWWP